MEKLENINLKEDETVVYTALFVNDIKLLKEKYPPVYQNHFYHHSVIDFLPENNNIHDLNLGKKYNIPIIGRVITDKIDALLLKTDNSVNDNPHITLSTAEGIRPFASNEEIAKAIDKGAVITINDTLEITEGYSNGETDIIE